MRRIEEQMRETICRYQMTDGCDRIIVGCSGGGDSTVLLHYLVHHFAGAVVAAHVNHCLRGEESERDERFVRQLCAEWNVPLFVHRADIGALAEARKQTIEECGREERYRFFQSLVEGETDRIATAHTLSDCGETMLFHMARGTGIGGLRGIPPVRGQIIRPLIGLTRGDVENYCRHYHLSYVDDSSNRSMAYTRNKIRWEVIPRLEEINPHCLSAMGRLARQMEEQEEALSFYADRLFASAKTERGYEIASLKGAPKAVVTHGVLRLLRERGEGSAITDQKLREIDWAMEKGSGGVTVSGKTTVRVEQGQLLFLDAPPQKSDWQAPLLSTEKGHCCGKDITVAVISPQNCKINENYSNFLFSNGLDYATIATNVLLRTRREGDTFRPKGRGVTKTLKKLLQEEKVPPSQRDRLVVAASGSELLWVEGFGVAEGYAISEGTDQIVTITVEEADHGARFGTSPADKGRD